MPCPADALQLYAGLELLTAAPSDAERDALEHRLVSCIALSERVSVARYARLAHAEIDRLLAEGALPIVVGGTGLYVRAALSDLDLRRPRLRACASAGWRSSSSAARRRCTSFWPSVSRRGQHRSQRPIAIASSALSSLPTRGALPRTHERSQLWSGEMRHPTRLIGLVMEREALHARIDRRVDEMLAAGALAEVQAALRDGVSATAGKALGFNELLDGDIEALKRRTRNYARRQLTWLRKLPDVELVDVTDRSPDDVAAALQ